MQCEKCNKNEAVQVKWRWNLCSDDKCLKDALFGPSKVIPCAFCQKRAIRVFWDKDVCSDDVCSEKARDGRLPESFGNLALTTFGKNDTRRASPPKYTAAQERKWSEVCGDLGFNKDGTQKT